MRVGRTHHNWEFCRSGLFPHREVPLYAQQGATIWRPIRRKIRLEVSLPHPKENTTFEPVTKDIKRVKNSAQGAIENGVNNVSVNSSAKSSTAFKSVWPKPPEALCKFDFTSLPKGLVPRCGFGSDVGSELMTAWTPTATFTRQKLVVQYLSSTLWANRAEFKRITRQKKIQW